MKQDSCSFLAQKSVEMCLKHPVKEGSMLVSL